MSFAKELVPLLSLDRIIKTMVSTGQLVPVKIDQKTGTALYKAAVPEIDPDGNLLG